MEDRRSISWRMVETVAALLLWLQATRVLFSVLFGLVYDALFDAEISFAVIGLVFAFVLAALLVPPLITFDPRRARAALLASIVIAAAARGPLAINDPTIRLVCAIVIIGSTGLYMALLLRRRPEMFPVSLVLALLADQIARAWGDTWDISLQPGFLPLQIVLCLAVIGVAWTAYSVKSSDPAPDRRLGPGGGLAIGGFLFLETAALAQPNVLARWTGIAYEWVAPVLLLATAFPLVYVFGRRFQLFGGRPLQSLEGWGVLARAGVLIVGVMLGLVIGRRLGGVAGLAGLLMAQLLMVLILPLMFGRHSPAPARESGRSLALGMIAFLVLHLAFAFAFTYPYTLAALRGAGLSILAVGAALAILPAVFRAPHPTPRHPVPINHRVVFLLSAAAVVVLMWAFPDPTAVREPGQVVRAATFNIHYGYNTDWEYLLEDQATAIEDCRADVVFLQEVDAGRITSYGVDNALWLARRLGMRAIFAPTLEGLSGIALLTRLPVLESEWALLPSALEQTAIVHARVAVGHGAMDAYGVWLGLEPEERMNQVTAALETIGNTELALLGGDMNSEPGSPVYLAIEAAGLSDPFVATGNLPAFTSPAVSPVKRIDYVWVRGLEPIRAQVSSSQASDHRLVVVELANK